MKLKAVENTVKEVVDTRELLDTVETPVSALLKKSMEIQEKCHDYNVEKVTLFNAMYHKGKLSFIDSNSNMETYPMSRYALSQLGSKIGVPANYLQKCLDTGRLDLASDNVNSWLDDYKKDLFIREYDGRIRGILSSKYSVCDTPDILKVLQDTVDLNTYKVKGSFLNEERLHLRLVGKEMLPIDGEDLFPGLFIDSSDIGRSILTVKFGIYKQVCTNGLVIARAGGTLFEQKHVGISTDDFYKGLVDSLKNIDVLSEHAVEWVQRASHKDNHWSSASAYEDDINEFVAYIRQNTNLSEEGSRKVIHLMNTKYTDNRWGLINGITEVAQDFTLERRLELEKIAGNLLAA